MDELVIRPVDPRDDAEMDAFQAVYADAERAEDPDTPLYSKADAIAMLLSSGTAGRLFEGYAAWVGDRMVGELLVIAPLLDNLQVAQVWVWVAPDHQRRGIGSRLSAYADDRVRELGRSVCHAQTRVGPLRSGNRAFVEKLGYTLANTEVERRLRLPVDPERLERLAAEAARHHPDYRIRTVVGPVPDDLAPSYVALKNLITVEMPSGELELEAGQETLAELQVQERDLTESGRIRVAAFALGPHGDVVAYTAAAVSAQGSDHVDQWGTLVHPAHRGHRLGMAVKCAQLEEIARAFPDKRHVTTQNAETNAPMVAINVALGFEVREIIGDFHKRL